MKIRNVFIFILFLSVYGSLFSQNILTTTVNYDTAVACKCQSFDVAVYLRYSNIQKPVNVNSFDLQLDIESDKIRFDSVVYINMKLKDVLKVEQRAESLIFQADMPSSTPLTVVGRMELVRFRVTPVSDGEARFNWNQLLSNYQYDGSVEIEEQYINDTVLVGSKVPLIYNLVQLVKGCSYESKGQYQVDISDGAAPYNYKWKDHRGKVQSTQTAFGLPEGLVYLTVSDKFNCRFYDSAFVSVNAAPKISFTYDTTKTYYISKPVIQFQNTSEDGFDWFWNFGDTTYSYEADPIKVFKRPGNFDVSLTATNNNACDTTVTIKVEIKDYELKIPNVFTPNGDGINDTFAIYVKDSEDEAAELRDMFYEAEIKIFTVNGKQVYYNKLYDNGWTGDNVTDGTYFYHLRVKGQYSEKFFKGTIIKLTGG